MTTLLNDAKAKVIISVCSHWINKKQINTQCTPVKDCDWCMFAGCKQTAGLVLGR